MARKTVKVDIPRNADKCIELVDKIIEKNTAMGNDSPLKSLPIAHLGEIVVPATAKNAEAKQMERDLSILYSQRDALLGDGTQTPDTARFILAQVRDLLLGIHRENPRMLGEWGFDVVEGQVSGGTKPTTP